jgi:hypothetical protein
VNWNGRTMMWDPSDYGTFDGWWKPLGNIETWMRSYLGFPRRDTWFEIDTNRS